VSDWPKYQHGTVENLDTHLLNFDEPVPTDQYRVQVVPYGTDYQDRTVSAAWKAYPYQLSGLPRGKYDAYTLWDTPDGQHIIDHIGTEGMPSLEVV
jgi:hypothetical protein